MCVIYKPQKRGGLDCQLGYCAIEKINKSHNQNHKRNIATEFRFLIVSDIFIHINK